MAAIFREMPIEEKIARGRIVIAEAIERGADATHIGHMQNGLDDLLATKANNDRIAEAAAAREELRGTDDYYEPQIFIGGPHTGR